MRIMMDIVMMVMAMALMLVLLMMMMMMLMMMMLAESIFCSRRLVHNPERKRQNVSASYRHFFLHVCYLLSLSLCKCCLFLQLMGFIPHFQGFQFWDGVNNKWRLQIVDSQITKYEPNMGSLGNRINCCESSILLSLQIMKFLCACSGDLVVKLGSQFGRTWHLLFDTLSQIQKASLFTGLQAVKSKHSSKKYMLCSTPSIFNTKMCLETLRLLLSSLLWREFGYRQFLSSFPSTS